MSTNRDGLTSPRPVLASLVAFIGAGLRPSTALARAITVVLAAKLIAVVAMAIFLFFANQHVVVDAKRPLL
jgi:hypothetical protein